MEFEIVDLIYLDQDRVKWPAHENAIMKLWLMKEEGFLDQIQATRERGTSTVRSRYQTAN
jgi:hypothetical protein